MDETEGPGTPALLVRVTAQPMEGTLATFTRPWSSQHPSTAVYPENTCPTIWETARRRLFTEELFGRVKHWKQPEMPTLRRRMQG